MLVCQRKLWWSLSDYLADLSSLWSHQLWCHLLRQGMVLPMKKTTDDEGISHRACFCKTSTFIISYKKELQLPVQKSRQPPGILVIVLLISREIWSRLESYNCLGENWTGWRHNDGVYMERHSYRLLFPASQYLRNKQNVNYMLVPSIIIWTNRNFVVKFLGGIFENRWQSLAEW